MHKDPFDLDSLLAQAKAQDAVPSDHFLETALANAYAHMPAPAIACAKPTSSWPQILNSFGGWKSATALTASALAGIWIGYADWQSLASTTGLAASYDSEISALDSFDGLDAMFTEG